MDGRSLPYSPCLSCPRACFSYLHVDNKKKIKRKKEKRKVFREDKKRTKDGQIEAEIALDAVSILNVFSLSIEFQILSTSCVSSESSLKSSNFFFVNFYFVYFHSLTENETPTNFIKRRITKRYQNISFYDVYLETCEKSHV